MSDSSVFRLLTYDDTLKMIVKDCHFYGIDDCRPYTVAAQKKKSGGLIEARNLFVCDRNLITPEIKSMIDQEWDKKNT